VKLRVRFALTLKMKLAGGLTEFHP
jgi:hypothetical protein